MLSSGKAMRMKSDRRQTMNRSKIEWCDHTWNPITGCLHNCRYCYARGMARRFCGDIRLNKLAKDDYKVCESASGEILYVLDEPMTNETGNAIVYPFGFEPTFHRYRLDYPTKLKMGNNIFVGAMADIWGEWVPKEWINEILDVCRKNPIHNYLFLTKNPKRYRDICVPIHTENMWYGTTITCEADIGNWNYLPDVGKRFISVEPLLEHIEARNNVIFDWIDWIIIGAETGKSKEKVTPHRQWIMEIVEEADRNNVPVFMKDSLIPIVGDKNMRRDYPQGLKVQKISEKMHNKLYDICYRCGREMKKSDMIALLARSVRGEQPKQYGFMCNNCFREHCKEYGIEIPKLKKMEDNINE